MLSFADGVNPITCNHRLTPSSGSAVPTGTVSSTTMYLTQYEGSILTLWDGGQWIPFSFPEISLALGTVTNGTPYDIFATISGGSPTLEQLIWGSSTARATGLVYQRGALVKSGDATRKYIGTYTPSSTTQCTTSLINRGIWNFQNRVWLPMGVQNTTDNNYTTATYREFAGTANRFTVTRGLDEDLAFCHARCHISNNNAGGAGVELGVGLDSTTVNNANQYYSFAATSTQEPGSAQYSDLPGLGVHFLAMLQRSSAVGTTTWYGVANTGGPSGMVGMVRC